MGEAAEWYAQSPKMAIRQILNIAAGPLIFWNN